MPIDTDILPIDDELCVVDGEPAAALLVSEFNRTLRRASAHHLRPMKRLLNDTANGHSQHTIDCALRHAQIMGGIKVITWITSGGVVGIVSAVGARMAGWL